MRAGLRTLSAATFCSLAVAAYAGSLRGDAYPEGASGWHTEEVRTDLTEGFASFRPYAFYVVDPLFEAREEKLAHSGPRRLLAYRVRSLAYQLGFVRSSRIYALKNPPRNLLGTYAEDPLERAGAVRYRDAIDRKRTVRDLEHLREVQRYRIAEVSLAGIRLERIPDADAGETRAVAPEPTPATPTSADPESSSARARASHPSSSAKTPAVPLLIGLALAVVGLGFLFARRRASNDDAWVGTRLRSGRATAIGLIGAGVAVVVIGAIAARRVAHRTSGLPSANVSVAFSESPQPPETVESVEQREARIGTSIQKEADRSYESRIAALESEVKNAKSNEDLLAAAKRLKQLKAALSAVDHGKVPWPAPELD